MSSVTGVSLNAIFPSGLVDRQQSTVSPQLRNESPLFVTVGESQATARQENRREINPDQRRQGNNAPATGADSRMSSSDNSAPAREQSRQELEKAQREGDLSRREAAQLQELQQLARRDREVRTHEQAHRAIAGQHAGPVRYEYEQGPDGRRYAVEGSVDVDLRPAEDPRETIQKMEQILRAALAPSEPSPTDRQVASEANQLIQEARSEALKEQWNLGSDDGGRADRQATSTERVSQEGSGESPGDVSRGTASGTDWPAAFAFSSDEGRDRLADTGNTQEPRGNEDRAARRAEEERRAGLDEQRSIVNTESQARLLEVQAAIAELLRNQSTSLNEVQLGRNVNFQI